MNKYNHDMQEKARVLKVTNIAKFLLLHHIAPNGERLFHDNEKNLEVTKSNDSDDDAYKDSQYSGFFLLKKKNIKLQVFGNCFVNILRKRLLNEKRIVLSLTGGVDSRILLAGLLHIGVKPDVYTFGYNKSKDVMISSEIAKSLGLRFINPSLPSDSQKAEWYRRISQDIINNYPEGIHLHRAHRLDAIKQVASCFDADTLIVGHMGGEGIRGLVYNDYFSSEIFYRYNEMNEPLKKLVPEILRKFYFRLENIDVNEVVHELRLLSYFGEDRVKNRFAFLYDHVASIHHNQDLYIYKQYFKNVIPFYLDDRYLKLLFSSRFSFLSKVDKLQGKLENPMLYSKLIKQYCPPLLDFITSNNYKPKEYLVSKYYFAFMKIIRDQLNRKHYPANFAYGDWFVDFMKQEVETLTKTIKDLFDTDQMIHDLYKNKHGTTEGYWLKYSNIIYLNMLLIKNGVK